jgi:hypothetical protein
MSCGVWRSVSKKPTASSFMVEGHSFTLKMKAVGFSNTFVTIIQTRRRHITEDSNFQSHYGENVRSDSITWVKKWQFSRVFFEYVLPLPILIPSAALHSLIILSTMLSSLNTDSIVK